MEFDLLVVIIIVHTHTQCTERRIICDFFGLREYQRSLCNNRNGQGDEQCGSNRKEQRNQCKDPTRRRSFTMPACHCQVVCAIGTLCAIFCVLGVLRTQSPSVQRAWRHLGPACSSSVVLDT